MTEIGAEVHAKISKVLNHHHIVECGGIAYYTEFFICEIDPGRVVGVGIYHGGDAARRQHLFEFCGKGLATIIVDIKRLLTDSKHFCLMALGRETGIDKQDCVLAFDALAQKKLKGETCLHRPYGGDDAFGSDVDVEKRFKEPACGLFQSRQTPHIGIDARAT